jgi:hypothetical protein
MEIPLKEIVNDELTKLGFKKRGSIGISITKK